MAGGGHHNGSKAVALGLSRPQACYVGFGGQQISRGLTAIGRGPRAVPLGFLRANMAIRLPQHVACWAYQVQATCNRLRLVRAEATENFDFYAFNIGDYRTAPCEERGDEHENLSNALPN